MYAVHLGQFVHQLLRLMLAERAGVAFDADPQLAEEVARLRAELGA